MEAGQDRRRRPCPTNFNAVFEEILCGTRALTGIRMQHAGGGRARERNRTCPGAGGPRPITIMPLPLPESKHIFITLIRAEV
jgi:hypothetical protein